MITSDINQETGEAVQDTRIQVWGFSEGAVA